MKIKHIAIAIAAAMAAPTAFAAPVDLSTYNYTIYVAGASAQTPGLAKAIVKFCTGTVQTFVDTQDGKQAFVWACPVANPTTSGITGSFVVAKVDAGGSFAGVDPVTNHTTIRFPDLTTADDTPTTNINSAVTVGAATAGTVAWNDGKATGSTAAGTFVYPQIALSDVSVNIWRARGNAIPSTGFTVNPIFAGQGFGVIVSPSLYTALQADQGLTGLTGVAAIPSISRQQYANVSQGVAGVSLNLLPNSANATALRISRRSDTSGTQAASDVYFLNNPCSLGTVLGGALTPKAAGTYTVSGPTTLTVVAESSTGNVKTNVGTATGFAIGVVSLENAESGLSGAKYVKIDGVSPTYYNGVADPTQKLAVINGQYDFAYESTLITNDIETPAGGAAQTFADKLVADQKNGANLTTSTGLYADASSTQRLLNATTMANTSNYSRSQNECKPAVYKY
jgi:hypothetical protein